MDPINLQLLLYLLLLLYLFYYSALLNLASRRTNQMVYITQEPLQSPCLSCLWLGLINVL